MPKQVDHDARRREIAAALWRLAAREGLEAASLSAVAAEAGVSKGRVQHYFAGRDELLAHAAHALHDRLGARVHAHLEIAGADPAARVRAVLTGLLPLADDARTDALVGSAFFVRAVSDPLARARLREGEEQILGLLTSLLADGLGEDAERAADVLLALTGGLADAVLVGRHTPDSALAILDEHLARLVGVSAAGGARR